MLLEPLFNLFTLNFGCGVFGSVIIEAIVILRYYQRSGRLPRYYRKVGFWVVRTVIALAAGILAVLYNPENPLLAVHIGVSTPLIVSTMAGTTHEK